MSAVKIDSEGFPYWTKDKDAVKAYVLDLRNHPKGGLLAVGESITAIAVSITAGNGESPVELKAGDGSTPVTTPAGPSVTPSAPTTDGSKVVVPLYGGTDGVTYTVTVHFVTDASPVLADDRSFRIKVGEE